MANDPDANFRSWLYQTDLFLFYFYKIYLNNSYLSRFYNNKTGINLFDTILNLRIEAAKEYLLNTDMKTYEISEAIGVDDAGYFSKMFKKITGVSPKEFRKQGKDEKNY